MVQIVELECSQCPDIGRLVVFHIVYEALFLHLGVT